MDTYVYVDILVVINYSITLLLILCCSRLTGKTPSRKRSIAGALVGAAGSLAIFLPYMGFFLSTLLKLALSAAILLAVYAPIKPKRFAMQMLVFFTVNFLFAGVVLALWISYAPKGMLFYNGIVYFDISPLVLIGCTALAYAAVSLFHRFQKGSRIAGDLYRVHIQLGEKSTWVVGFLDTGNHLYEPFSDSPVVICYAGDLLDVLSPLLVQRVVQGSLDMEAISGFGVPLRLIPYDSVGSTGLIAAFKPDALILEKNRMRHKVERVYVGISPKPVGTDSYNAILGPDLMAEAV